MTEMWTTLLPLAVASAILPIQVAITILMLRSPRGRVTATGWVGGMTVVRLAQWVLLGLVLGAAVDDGEPGTSAVEATLLLVVGIVFLVSAARKLAKQPDEDAPPPRWMSRVGGVTPGRAFTMGAGVVGLSPKLWAFNLAAIGAIADADLGAAASTAVFVVSSRAEVTLGRVSGALERHNRVVMIALSAVFGAWFLVKSLAAFGIL
jgi:hypothetical protein